MMKVHQLLKSEVHLVGESGERYNGSSLTTASRKGINQPHYDEPRRLSDRPELIEAWCRHHHRRLRQTCPPAFLLISRPFVSFVTRQARSISLCRRLNRQQRHRIHISFPVFHPLSGRGSKIRIPRLESSTSTTHRGSHLGGERACAACGLPTKVRRKSPQRRGDDQTWRPWKRARSRASLQRPPSRSLSSDDQAMPCRGPTPQC